MATSTITIHRVVAISKETETFTTKHDGQETTVIRLTITNDKDETVAIDCFVKKGTTL